MKISLIGNRVCAVAENADESALLLSFADAPRKKTATVAPTKKAYKRQYSRDCDHEGCDKRVKGNLGQAIHSASAHKTEESL